MAPPRPMISSYREWLAINRERNALWFRMYDGVANAIVRILRPPERPTPPAPMVARTQRFQGTPSNPEAWGAVFLALDRGAKASEGRPTISILTPAWNTKPQWFCEAAVSVLDQTRTDWEWIVVDDGSTKKDWHVFADQLTEVCPRFKLHILDRNRGISEATNAALHMARGEYVCMLDHDDLLHPRALEECLRILEEDVNLDAVYTDSNKVSESGDLDEPFYKPDWSPEYFRGVMFVGHLLCVRRELAIAAGGFDKSFDGVQDFEFFLRYSERSRKIGHVAKILYHWRRAEGSIASAHDAKDDISELQLLAVRQQLRRIGALADATAGRSPHRVSIVPGPRKSNPLVSVIIPTRDAPDVLSMCLDTLQSRSSYPNLQIICADNDTVDLKALSRMREPGIERVPCPGAFNFSRINNQAIRQTAKGEYLVLLNNDVEVLTPDWVQEMLYYAEQPDVGAVGALLVYPNQTVQHAGVVLGFRGTADHVLRGVSPDTDGYAGSVSCAREVSAVTGACLMVKRSAYEEIGGLNEYYHVLYQDVDFCLRMQSAGRRNIFAPRASLIHHESYTRKSDYNLVDRALLIDCWEDSIRRDPYFNPNFSRDAVDYQIAAHADLGNV